MCDCHGGYVLLWVCATTERTVLRGPNVKGSLSDEVSAVGADRGEAVCGAQDTWEISVSASLFC